MSKIWRVIHQPYLHFVSSAGDVVSADEMAMYVTWLEKAKRSTDDIVSSQPFPLNTAVWEPVPNTGLEIKVVPSAKGIVVRVQRVENVPEKAASA